MNPRTWARYFIASSSFLSGLVNLFGTTGLVIELSPDGRWGTGVRSIAVGGLLQLVGAVVLASGRMTPWALILVGSYVLLVGVFGNLPLLSNPDVGLSALAGLLVNLAIIGGILYWFRNAPEPSHPLQEGEVPISIPGPDLFVRLILCMTMMAGAFCWVHAERSPDPHKTERVVPQDGRAPVLPVKLIV